MLQFKYVTDRLKGVDIIRCLSVWHWAVNGCIRVVVISNKYVFVAFIGSILKFTGQIDLDYFILSFHMNDRRCVVYIRFVTLGIGVYLQ